ncbi:MAG: BatD family protein [Alloprevotella sp.]
MQLHRHTARIDFYSDQLRKIARAIKLLVAATVLSFAAGFSPTGNLRAQTVVEARLDRTDILIGEQVELQTKVTVPRNARVEYPGWAARGEITPGVEIVSTGSVDTTELNGGHRVTLARTYLLTSFDSALYKIPPFEVKVDGRIAKSKAAIGLKVNNVAVDTVNLMNFPGPKGVVEAPFVWEKTDFLLACALWVLLLAALACAMRLSDSRPLEKRIVIPAPEPAHRPAISAIEEIRRHEPADVDALRHYYDRLTDVLRTYILQRFGVGAKEMTSAEIVERLAQINDPSALRELREILETADLVKFAKHNIDATESERSCKLAEDYVNTTKRPPEEEPGPRIETVVLPGGMQRGVRIALRAGCVVFGTLSAALTAYLVYELWLLV